MKSSTQLKEYEDTDVVQLKDSLGNIVFIGSYEEAIEHVRHMEYKVEITLRVVDLPKIDDTTF